MKLVRHLMLASGALWLAGSASALEVTFTYESYTSYDAGFPTTATYTPPHPFSGTGDIDEAAGTYDVSLPDFTIVLDVLDDGEDDSQIDTEGWEQAGTFIPGSGLLALTGTSSSGTVTCTVLGGIGGLVCGLVLPTVQTWPPVGDPGPTLGAAGAWIDTEDGPGYDGTIVVTEPYDPNAGQIQNIYRYTFAPEPDTDLLMSIGLGLIGFGSMAGRKRR